jgi:hypothetical protein
MAGPADLTALAQQFLNACIQALDTIPSFVPGLAGAPARSFIAPGPPVFDCCPQLTVHVAQINSLPHNVEVGHSASYTMENIVTLVASSIRCVEALGTDGNPPTPVLQQQEASQINADGWALWNHIYNLVAAGLLFTLCGRVYFDRVQFLTPQGGCGGVAFQVRAELDGYMETLSS